MGTAQVADPKGHASSNFGLINIEVATYRCEFALGDGAVSSFSCHRNGDGDNAGKNDKTQHFSGARCAPGPMLSTVHILVNPPSPFYRQSTEKVSTLSKVTQLWSPIVTPTKHMRALWGT